MKELIINPKEVIEAILDCFYKEEELKNGIPEEAIILKGVTRKFVFHPNRLEEKRSKVTKWLEALPHQFRKNGGGGWYFLNACYQQNGVQWTGVYRRMDELFCLALALGLAEYGTSRVFWSAFPEGMPYYTIYV